MPRFFLISCILLLFGLKSFSFAPSNIRVTIDVESAKAVTALITRTTVTDDELNAVASLYGNQQLIKKVKSYSGAGEMVFKSTLKELIITGGIKGDDPYNWRSVKQSLPQISALVNRIVQNREGFVNDVSTRIKAYAPDGLDVNVKACFLAGGGSLGFAIGEDPTFNVALQRLSGDYASLELMVAHELYHVVQGIGQKNVKAGITEHSPYYLQAAAGLIDNLWLEGTANLVGDFADLKSGTPFAKEQLDEWKKNAERRRENFLLFESVLYKTYKDTASQHFERAYNICFTNAFDETTYFVGYEMAKAIEKYKGKATVAAFITKPTLTFIQAYIDLYHETKDERLIHFDPSTEAILKEMAAVHDH